MVQLFLALPSLGLSAGTADAWAREPVTLAKGLGRTQPFANYLLAFMTQKEGKPEKLCIPCHTRTSKASVSSVSRISIWQEIPWWAKNIYHLRRETQKRIISAASILPDHFTQTPGREKHYFTVRTLNVAHTFGSFFFPYMITAYLWVSHLKLPPERELKSGDFQPITSNWDKSWTRKRGSVPGNNAEDGHRKYHESKPWVHFNMFSCLNFLIKTKITSLEWASLNHRMTIDRRSRGGDGITRTFPPPSENLGSLPPSPWLDSNRSTSPALTQVLALPLNSPKRRCPGKSCHWDSNLQKTQVQNPSK